MRLVRGQWRHEFLTAIPDAEETAAIAMRLRRSLFGGGDALAPLGDIRKICRRGRFRLLERRLGGARGGLEAVLAPAKGDRFEIHVDPEPFGGWGSVPPDMRVMLRRQRLRFRVAHEMAHSFFYDREGAVPCRRLAGSRRQEDFCDRFAAEFLLPSEAVRAVEGSAKNLVDLAERFDVSLQVAVRSFAGQWEGGVVALFIYRQGELQRQWASGDDHLPIRWWRHLDAYRGEGCQVLPLPQRQQLLVVSPA